MEMKKIGLIGLGACGTVYAAALQQAFGENFRVVARGRRARRLGEWRLNGESLHFLTPEKGWQADLLWVAVKNYDLETAIDDIRPYVGAHTVLLPTLNGISAKAVLSAAFPYNTVLYGVDMRIDALRQENGVVLTKPAHIVFGKEYNENPDPEVLAVAAVLEQAGISHEMGANMIRETWKKWMWNIGFNQVTAALDATYGDVATIPEIYDLAERAMFEVYAVAQYMEIPLSTDDILVKRYAYQNAAPYGKTSMAQDMEAGRPTEVEYFAGMLSSLSQRTNTPCPVNEALYLMIKAREAQKRAAAGREAMP